MIDFDGTLVDSMILRGREITLEAMDQFKPIAIIAAYSGGNDSIVSTHFAVTEFKASVVHCNTGIGIKKTTDHVRSTCLRFGWNLTEEVAIPEGRPAPLTDDKLPSGGWVDGETAYEEFVLNFGFAGPGQHHRMYQRLKERSIQRHLRKIKQGTPRGTKVVIISGIRGDESSVRAGYKRAIQKNGAEIWVNPFYWQTATDFEIYRQEFGLPRNPVKDQVGISGECLCGAYSSGESERAAIRTVEPETADYIDRLEVKVRSRGFPWGWGCKPPKWYRDSKRGQGFLFDSHDKSFAPMCVGCTRRQPQ